MYAELKKRLTAAIPERAECAEALEAINELERENLSLIRHRAAIAELNDRLRRALAPFAKWAGWFDKMMVYDEHVVHGRGNLPGEAPDYILLRDLREARAALEAVIQKAER